MAEYKLSYTANEIDERLGKVSTLESKVNEMATEDKIVGAKTENSTVTFKDKEYTCKSGAEIFNNLEKNLAIGKNSHAEGEETTALDSYTHAEGWRTTARGHSSHSEGSYTVAAGMSAHAEGSHTIANGTYAHAEGFRTQAQNTSSHAEGSNTIANTPSLHVEGKFNLPEILPNYAVARGYMAEGDYEKYDGEKIVYLLDTKPIFNSNDGTFAIDSYSEIAIKNLAANNYIVFKKPQSNIISQYYEISHLLSQETTDAGVTTYQWYYSILAPTTYIGTGTYAHIVGNGASDSERSNAHTLDWDGNAWYQGTLKLGGSSYDDANEVALKSEVDELREALQTVTEELNALKESLNS